MEADRVVQSILLVVARAVTWFIAEAEAFPLTLIATGGLSFLRYSVPSRVFHQADDPMDPAHVWMYTLAVTAFFFSTIFYCGIYDVPLTEISNANTRVFNLGFTIPLTSAVMASYHVCWRVTDNVNILNSLLSIGVYYFATVVLLTGVIPTIGREYLVGVSASYFDFVTAVLTGVIIIFARDASKYIINVWPNQ